MNRAQNRNGSAQRRKLEFNCVLRAVKKDKAAFTRRLQRRVEALPDGCVVYRATTSDGYPGLTLRHNGEHLYIKAARVFLILKLARPIRIGHDAGHEEFCKRRDCVRHVFEQPTGDNCSATRGGRLHEEPPF